MKINPLLLTDFYKVGHVFQYPKNTTLVYSNLTPRKSRLNGAEEMVFFGLQYFCKKYLIEYFNENFFDRPKEEIVSGYKRTIEHTIGQLPTYEHIEALHDLGYLPIKIKALPEGSRVPMRCACLTIVNTLPEFYWLTNFIESLLSNCLWQPCTSATIAYEYKKLLTDWSEKTGMQKDFVQWQAHDFSFRGMSSYESSLTSGAAHLLSFTGTDTIPAILFLEKYYSADIEKELVGGSVAATEHSVMCVGQKEGEIETFERLVTKVYPNGVISIVSDTWNLWTVLTDYLPQLKDQILARDGKVVIRPDSGDPVDIICGAMELDFENEETYWHDIEYHNQPEHPVNKGVVELLWDEFGGTVNEKGYKVLNEKVGVIYGDSITLSRANEMCKRLAQKGFASQCVFGVGSFTYQYNTRDTFGMAVKATYAEVSGVGRNIFKDPATDDGTKKSAKGLLMVDVDADGSFIMYDERTWEQESGGFLKTVFLDGKMVSETTLSEVRERINIY